MPPILEEGGVRRGGGWGGDRRFFSIYKWTHSATIGAPLVTTPTIVVVTTRHPSSDVHHFVVQTTRTWVGSFTQPFVSMSTLQTVHATLPFVCRYRLTKKRSANDCLIFHFLQSQGWRQLKHAASVNDFRKNGAECLTCCRLIHGPLFVFCVRVHVWSIHTSKKQSIHISKSRKVCWHFSMTGKASSACNTS